ncbi:ABC transporter permease [Lacticaseibacillus zhaodongensis]|uniref:ABC transporter permease n=1 Tax=Lacticaseibacillus zhaodongensis TaxID=2668065 RepID=UPI001E512366|nr:ABC transporter permease [Lacticaseibacillus zhaodongensis]
MRSNHAKFGLLLRVYLRRDWLLISLWALGLVGLMAGAAAKFDGLYGTKAAMDSIIKTLNTPAMVSLLGVFEAKRPYSPALIYAAEMMVFMGLFTAMMNIYFAVKNTRGDEDSGVAELIAARAVGRQSQLLAASCELIIINLVIGVLEALGLQLAGMTGSNAAGNWLFGLGLAAFGIMFAAMAVLAAQLVTSARSATALSYAVLGVVFVARMVTDVQNPDLTWWTGFGWIEKLAIYADNNWGPLLLMLAMAVIFAAAAGLIAARRDVGSGVLPQRRGRKTASPLLVGPASLLLRLERTSTAWWVLGMFLLGVSYGSIFGTAGDLMKTNPMLAKIIGTSATTKANHTVVLAFSNKLTMIFAVAATVFALLTLFRLNNDEKKGYLEQLHARSVSRLQLYLSYAGYALISASAAFAAAILGMALAGNASMDAPIVLARYMRGFAGYWPALAVTVGIAAALVGLIPRLQNIAWIVPIYGVFSLYLGSLLDLPKWAQRVSPYGWINDVPLKQIAWGTWGWMSLLAGALLLLGYAAYRRRDLQLN